MKVAVCLSGHLRKFEQTFHSLKVHLLNNYDCDVFIHTWDKMGYGCNYKTDVTLDNTDRYIEKVKQLYQPKNIIVENSSFIEELKNQGNEYAPHLRNEPKHVGHMASMFYKIYAANELRKRYQIESGVNYDWVIRCRPDLAFQNTIKLPNTQINNVIYMPQNQCSVGWLNDQFAIGLSDDIDLYSSFFFNMNEYFSAKNEFYPEKFVDWSMKKANLHAKMIDIKFHILR